MIGTKILTLEIALNTHILCWDRQKELTSITGYLTTSPENGNRFNFRNVVFCIVLQHRTMDEVQKAQ
jgi:hypothetical protein